MQRKIEKPTQKAATKPKKQSTAKVGFGCLHQFLILTRNFAFECAPNIALVYLTSRPKGRLY